MYNADLNTTLKNYKTAFYEMQFHVLENFVPGNHSRHNKDNGIVPTLCT
jgi:hypothetical protein